MREKLKIRFVVFCVIVATMLFALNVNAATTTPKLTFADAWLTFDIWQGSGTSSINIGDNFLTEDCHIVKFDEFEELQYDGKIFDKSNYIVTEVDGNTVITLKEEYLKTLNDGMYLFDIVFSRVIISVRLHVVTHKVNLTDAHFDFNTWTGSGDAQATFKVDTVPFTFYTELFNGLLYKGEKVDNSNYYLNP